MNSRTAIPILVGGVIGLFIDLAYFRWYSDIVDRWMGQVFSFWVLPMIVFLAIVGIEIFFVPYLRTSTGLRSSWFWLLVAAALCNVHVIAYKLYDTFGGPG